MAKASLGKGDLAIIQEAQDLQNPGIFTSYYFRPADNPESAGFTVFPTHARYEPYKEYWEKNGKPKEFAAEISEITFDVEAKKDSETGRTVFFEKRGYVPLQWHLDFYRSQQLERYVIGLAGSGKTMGIGALAMYMCATIPNFKFVNVAPTQFQSRQMLNAIRDVVGNTLFTQKFVAWHGKKWFVEAPYIRIDFQNGSSAEFMNVDKNAENIQSSYGDWYNIDEAGLLNELDEFGRESLAGILIGVASRMRATAPGGRPRMGLLSLISMAYDCDTLWDRYEASLVPNKTSWGRLVTHKDNPYLSKADIARIERNAKEAGVEDQWIKGLRPQPMGSEISEKIIRPVFVASKNEIAKASFENGEEGWEYHSGSMGVYWYEEPRKRDHIYMMAGDPGQGNAPDRNAPTILVWDVTEFPEGPAQLAAFWWGFGNGRYQPFIQKFESLIHKYRVDEMYRGYDSTASQKAIAELSFEAGGLPVLPLGFDGIKKWQYLNALKIILGRELLKAPEIDGLRKQLSRYRIPDTKISQDLVSAMAMCAFLMYPLYRMAYPEVDEGQDLRTWGVSDPISRNTRRHYDRGGRGAR
jgi:hypothetical protein